MASLSDINENNGIRKGGILLKQAVEQVTSFTSTAKQTHPRFYLRWTSLQAIVLASILNFFCWIIAFSDYDDAPKYVVVFASVTLGISFAYQTIDLLCTPTGNNYLLDFHIPAPYLLAVDTLGFLSFLALLIANGIVVHDLYRGGQMYVYNSLPWMVCCYIHGRVAFDSGVRALKDLVQNQNSGGASEAYCCVECKNRASGKRDEDSGTAEAAPLLVLQHGRGTPRTENDVEAGLP